MPLEERELPLFPLNAVLFPTTALPLQIFEERYKLMLQHCLDSDSTFGVVLIKSGSDVGEPAEPCQVGTTAKIVQTSRIQAERIFISVFGQHRFEIIEILQQRPYIVARIRALDEGSSKEVPPQLVQEVQESVAEYVRMLMGLRGGWVREVDAPEDPVALSYFVGGVLQLELPERQRLLEASPVLQRLKQESELLPRETEALRKRIAQGEARLRFSLN